MAQGSQLITSFGREQTDPDYDVLVKGAKERRTRVVQVAAQVSLQR